MNIMRITESVLPSNYRNKILTTQNKDGKVTIRSNVDSMEAMKVWITEFSNRTNTQWIVRKSNPSGKQMVSMKTYICHHSSYKNASKLENFKRNYKNVDCRAKISIKIKLTTSSTKHKDPFVKDGLMAVIHIWTIHSHFVGTAQAIWLLQADHDLKRTFFEYFDDGMAASEAKRFHEVILTANESFTEIDFTDSNKNPTSRTVSYWYDLWKRDYSGPRSEYDILQILNEKRSFYEENNVSVVFSEDPFCIFVATPLMKQVHELPTSSQIAFLDSITSEDTSLRSVTLFLTVCATGVVPLGVLITKEGSVETYAVGFSLINSALKNAFGSRGYPAVIMTDNSAAQMAAIELVWPDSINLLSVHHVQQDIWHWLWDPENAIVSDHRPLLMESFKKIIGAESVSDLDMWYADCLKCGSQYARWTKFISEVYWPVKEKWCSAYRTASMRNDYDSNFVSVSIKIFRDLILSRVGADHVLSVIHFCCTSLDSYCRKKFEDFANFEEVGGYALFRCSLDEVSCISRDDIIRLSDILFIVPDKGESSSYFVEADIGTCSCRDGRSGKFCQHLNAVYLYYDILPENFPNVTPVNRQTMWELATKDELSEANTFCEVTVVDEGVFLEEEEPTDPPVSLYESENLPLDECALTSQVEVDTNTPFSITKRDEKAERLAVALCQSLCSKISSYKSTNTCQILKLLIKGVRKVNSEESLEDFLHSIGSKMPHHQSNNSKVQRVSVSDRVTRRAKKISETQPAKCEKWISDDEMNVTVTIVDSI